MRVKGSFKTNKFDWEMLIDKTKVRPLTGNKFKDDRGSTDCNSHLCRHEKLLVVQD